jgi:predicted membrane chloride channel (bestrophin family)
MSSKLERTPSTKTRSNSILLQNKEQLTEMHEKIFGIESTDKLTANQLIKAERHRRELLQRSKIFSREHLYLQIWGTVIPAVIRSGEFWFSLFVYVVIRLCIVYGVTTSVDISIDSKTVGTIGGFISFMLVFYNNQVYSRYAAQYDNSMKMEGKILNLTYFARDNLQTFKLSSSSSSTSSTTNPTNTPTPAEEKATAMVWQFVRYLNGAHILGYVGLSDTYERDNLFEPFNKKFKMFTVSELQRLEYTNSIDDSSGACYREVLGWASSLLQEAHRSGQLVAVVYNNMMNELLALRGHINTLYEYDDQPIPFVYVHLIYFLIIFYLPLFSFFVATSFDAGHAWSNCPGFVVVFLNSLFTVGLLEIGRFMSEPYGSDNCDLSVIHYLKSTWLNCRKILAAKRFDVSTLALEQEMEEHRPVLGDGYVTGTMSCDILSSTSMNSLQQKDLMANSQNVLHHGNGSHKASRHAYDKVANTIGEDDLEDMV